jgi:hypothetical protein
MGRLGKTANHMSEVIPMKSKAYRATDVKHIDLRSLPASRQGLSLVVGVDVAKDHHIVPR